MQTIKIRKARLLIFESNIVLKGSLNTNTVIVVSDANIRNNVAIFITHVHSYSSLIKKTIHYAVNIIITEVEIFAIRYGINEAVQIIDVFYIIIITNSIHSVYQKFNQFIHSY